MCIGSGLRGGGGTALVYRSADLARGELVCVSIMTVREGEGHFDDALEGCHHRLHPLFLLTSHCIQNSKCVLQAGVLTATCAAGPTRRWVCAGSGESREGVPAGYGYVCAGSGEDAEGPAREGKVVTAQRRGRRGGQMLATTGHQAGGCCLYAGQADKTLHSLAILTPCPPSRIAARSCTSWGSCPAPWVLQPSSSATLLHPVPAMGCCCARLRRPA